MKLSARGFFSIGKHLFLLLILSSLLLTIFTAPAFAQENTTPNTYTAPNTNPDVPRNDHTRAQSVLIETSAALICQLVGIDIITPEKGCLGVDPVTQKIGYSSQTEGEEQQVDGLLGMSGGLIGALYTPPASGVSYMAKTLDEFGIVKNTYAQDTDVNERTGFDALGPVQKIWETSRNLAYLFLVIVFIFIGMAIMLRVKIDPRTSMTIQNQLPKIVIAIILITFSYSIIGFAIDLMWLTTYVAINTLAPLSSEIMCDSNPPMTIQETAYVNLLNFPLAFLNDIFKNNQLFPGACESGVINLSREVGGVIGDIISDMVNALFGVNDVAEYNIADPGTWGGAIIGGVLGWIGKLFGLLVAFVAIIVVMFRLWINLLKAYAYIIFYTILGPFWILLGLLPNPSFSFTVWLRTLTAKLLAFPAAIGMILIARAVMGSYNDPTRFTPEGDIIRDQSLNFAPPLVGNPNIAGFGPLIAFAILLITPEVLTAMNDAFKAHSGKIAGPAITKGFGAGGSIVGGFVGSQVARATRFDPHKGEVGSLAGKGVDILNAARGRMGMSSIEEARNLHRQKAGYQVHGNVATRPTTLWGALRNRRSSRNNNTP